MEKLIKMNIINYITLKLKTKMDKAAALKEMTSLENKMKDLRKIIEAPQKITDRVKTFEDACEVLGIDSNSVSMCGDTRDEIAYKKMKIIVKALNEGWTPNWKNGNEAKYYPYFDLSSGFGFSAAGYYYACTYSAVGSRLCFKTRELSDYSGKQFEAIYKDLLILEN